MTDEENSAKRNATADKAEIIDVLLERHSRTFAAEAGIRLERNTPAPLYRLLCLSLLISARISTEVALSASRALADAGWTTPEAMQGSTWEERTKVLNESGYARYDESTARYLADATALLIDRYGGDLRELRAAAEGDRERAHRLLTDFKGIGDVGADVFLREVQSVWDELGPFADDRALTTADAIGLPTTTDELRALVDDQATFAELVAALVRCGLAGDHEEMLEEARAR